jgi:hypothetical protein
MGVLFMVGGWLDGVRGCLRCFPLLLQRCSSGCFTPYATHRLKVCEMYSMFCIHGVLNDLAESLRRMCETLERMCEMGVCHSVKVCGRSGRLRSCFLHYL